jgi:hypothetical protein
VATETIHYTDGGHADREATLERDGDRATLVVGALRVPLDLTTRDPGGAVVKGVTTEIAVASYAVLGLMKQWNRNYGDRVAFEVGGRRVIGLYQEHPPDKGKNYPHPGLTLLEPTGAETAPPGAPGSVLLLPDLPPQPGGASTAPGAPVGDLLVAGGCAAVGVLLFALAASGFGGAASGAVDALRSKVTLGPMPLPAAGRVNLRAVRRGQVSEWFDLSLDDAVEIARPLVRSGWRCHVRTSAGRTWDLAELAVA